jgi:hypothetical protein
MRNCCDIRERVVIGGELELHNNIDGDMDLQNVVDGESQSVLKEVTSEHNELTHRDWPNQHPIQSITGLQDALDSKIDISDFSIINCGTSTEVI